jgi:hypothetical protein
VIDTSSDEGAWKREMERTRNFQPKRMRPVWEIEGEGEKVKDTVISPPHYTAGGIETIDYIAAKLSPDEMRGYCLGNALKYLSRSGKKGDGVEDVRKAIFYLQYMAGRDPRKAAYEDGAA